MSGLYDPVHSAPPRKKKSTRLWVCLVLSVLLLVTVIIPITWGAWYRRQFYCFVSDLSESTIYAYRHVCLKTTWQGEPKVVSNTGIYGPYRILSAAGTGKPTSSLPDYPPDVLLDYGDGSSLSFWTTDVDATQDLARTEGLLVHYVNQLGEPFTYRTDSITLSSLHFALFP